MCSYYAPLQNASAIAAESPTPTSEDAVSTLNSKAGEGGGRGTRHSGTAAAAAAVLVSESQRAAAAVCIYRRSSWEESSCVEREGVESNTAHA
jgi:hypothetical protein